MTNQQPRGSVSSSALAEQYAVLEALEIPKKGRHQRRMETIVTIAGIAVSITIAGLGLWFALHEGTSQVVRTMAAGWVGVVLGQAKRVWRSN
jgi:hypothetical protein